MITLTYTIALFFLFLQTSIAFYRGHLLREEYASQGGYTAYAKTSVSAFRFIGANLLVANWFLAAAVYHYLFG